jgi:RNA polymerase sigma-70 factor (ECF subfamily)
MPVHQHDDPYLVKCACAGDKEAFAILVQRHEHGVYSYLTGLLGDREEARDFAQLTFIKAWSNLSRLQDAAHFKPWLYTIARNLVYDFWRKQKFHQQSWESLEESSVVASSPGPEERTIQMQMLELALAHLPAKLRDCILLQDVCGFSRREIASMIGIGVESVSTYLSSARKLLRQTYQRMENEYELEKGDLVHE